MHIISVYEIFIYFLTLFTKKSKSMITLFTTVKYGIYFGCVPVVKRAHLTSIYLNILTRCACVFPTSSSGCRNTLHAARISARQLLTHQMHPFISIAPYINIASKHAGKIGNTQGIRKHLNRVQC